MGVQAARVQRVVKGDDFSFKHTIVGPKSVGNNEQLGLIEVAEEDVVKAIYETEQPEDTSLPAVDPIEIVGVVVVGEASTFTFAGAAADSEKLATGLGKTVRIEITRESGKLETYYLFNEYDVVARGFPAHPQSISLP